MVTSPRQSERNAKRAAVQVRWQAEAEKKQEWHTMPLEEAVKRLASLRADAELGAQIIQSRAREKEEDNKCVICGTPVRGVPASIITVRDAATLLAYNEYYCSAECLARKQQRQTGQLNLVR